LSGDGADVAGAANALADGGGGLEAVATAPLAGAGMASPLVAGGAFFVVEIGAAPVIMGVGVVAVDAAGAGSGSSGFPGLAG